MNLPDTLTDKQRLRAEAYIECGESESKAAGKLGISVTALRKSLWGAVKKGVVLGPTRPHDHTPTGWGVTKTTVQRKADGSEVQRWDREQPVIDVEAMCTYLEQRTPVNSISFPAPKKCNEDLMLEWPVFDTHHGMLAWEDETGANYDTKISRHLQESAAKILFDSVGPVKRIEVTFGGDNQTSDNRAGLTEKSGNSVDTDSRFAKIIWCSFETSVATIELGLQFAEEVHIRVLSGNHDYHSALHLTIQLHAYFRNNPRVKVDTSPAKHRFYRWGSNVFMASHGDQIKDTLIPAYMLNQIIDRNMAADGPITNKLVRLGHLHKRKKISALPPELLNGDRGVIVERFPTLAAPEAYTVEGAYLSTRATDANLWHREYGRVGGREITVGEIMAKYPLLQEAA